MICKDCKKEMELIDEDPGLGKMWNCNECRLEFIRVGSCNAFDRTGWKRY